MDTLMMLYTNKVCTYSCDTPTSMLNFWHVPIWSEPTGHRVTKEYPEVVGYSSDELALCFNDTVVSEKYSTSDYEYLIACDLMDGFDFLAEKEDLRAVRLNGLLIWEYLPDEEITENE